MEDQWYGLIINEVRQGVVKGDFVLRVYIKMMVKRGLLETDITVIEIPKSIDPWDWQRGIEQHTH
jgi:hypothetical protein